MLCRGARGVGGGDNYLSKEKRMVVWGIERPIIQTEFSILGTLCWR